MTVHHCAVTTLIGGSTTPPVTGTIYIHQEGLGMMEPGAVVTKNTAPSPGTPWLLLTQLGRQTVLIKVIKLSL